MIPKASVTLDLGPIDLSMTVRVIRAGGDWDEDDDHDPAQVMTLGELIAELVLERADEHGQVTVAARQRLEEITDGEVRAYARRVITTALGQPIRPTVESLTLAARIEQVVRDQLTDTSRTFAHGREATVVESVIQTAVTDAFRSMAASVVEQVRAQALAEIARNAG
jgi:hypothetical protein